MTDVQRQKKIYTPDIQSRNEVPESEINWDEPDSVTNQSVFIDANQNVPTIEESEVTNNSVTNPAEIMTGEETNSAQILSPIAVDYEEEKSDDMSQPPTCEISIDAGVDKDSNTEGTRNEDPEIEEANAEEQPDSAPKEHVFRIAVEDDMQEDNKADDQIYYLPLAIGASGGKPEADNLDLSKIPGLGTNNQSDNVLRDLGKPLSQMADSVLSTHSVSNESISNAGSRPLSQAESTTMTGSTTTSSFLTSKSTLVTDSLLKTGNIPESITQQFNQIAKLNKSSLRSRRTVRTTTTRVTPGQITSVPVSSTVSDTNVQESRSDKTSSPTGRFTSEIPISTRVVHGIQSSTSSLPSLGTAGSSSTGAAISLEHQTTVPAGSDPGLQIESSKESTGPSGSPPMKSDGSTLPSSTSVEDQVRISDNSYVTLSYMIPLKQEKILDDQQVDTIFYKINELFNYHLSFLNTLQMWELTNTVGDKLLDMRRQLRAIYYSVLKRLVIFSPPDLKLEVARLKSSLRLAANEAKPPKAA
ncbi:unnamed protein product [Echinostoma caproni]|uniref:DH domain-containing protein n=1 Tax=Echinostoma caproni TaxID=27848 RepID=A0A183AB17_9TREM|nr:unnamed protein product [Echinostoma caproni]